MVFRLTTKLSLSVTKPNCRRSLINIRFFGITDMLFKDTRSYLKSQSVCYLKSQEEFCKSSVLSSVTKFTRKHLCRSLLLKSSRSQGE